MNSTVDINLIVLLVFLGSLSGFAAGLLGIGGGMLLVPFLTMVFSAIRFPQDLIVHMAIATSLATIAFTSLSSFIAHQKKGLILWKIVFFLIPGILIGSWVGPFIGSNLNSASLSIFFSLFVGFSATQMLFEKKASPSRVIPKFLGMSIIGSFIGVLSGLVGAGGGFLSVPFMVWCNVKIHNAVATSAALGFPIALIGSFSNIYYGSKESDLPYSSIGYIFLPALISISIASIFTAPLGAKVAHSMPVGQLKKIFAIVLYILAIYMLIKSLSF